MYVDKMSNVHGLENTPDGSFCQSTDRRLMISSVYLNQQVEVSQGNVVEVAQFLANQTSESSDDAENVEVVSDILVNIVSAESGDAQVGKQVFRQEWCFMVVLGATYRNIGVVPELDSSLYTVVGSGSKKLDSLNGNVTTISFLLKEN